MRMVADGVVDTIGTRPDFTVAGTLVIVIVAAIVGAPFGVLYAIVGERLPVRAGLRGLLFGIIVLLAIGPFFLRTDEFFSQGRVMLFAVLFLVFGVSLGLVLAPSRRIVSRVLPIANARA